MLGSRYCHSRDHLPVHKLPPIFLRRQEDFCLVSLTAVARMFICTAVALQTSALYWDPIMSSTCWFNDALRSKGEQTAAESCCTVHRRSHCGGIRSGSSQGTDRTAVPPSHPLRDTAWEARGCWLSWSKGNGSSSWSIPAPLPAISQRLGTEPAAGKVREYLTRIDSWGGCFRKNPYKYWAKSPTCNCF